MIRRHAFWFRALLIAADAVLAIGLLVALSIWRFGPDWAVWWREIVPQPEAFLLLYAGTWVAVLTLNGLYRPRARWTLRSEAIAIVRATAVMALVTLSVLFLFRLPDVSRLLLLVLFPAQAVATIVERAVLRVVLERYRRRGNNLRFVLVLGAGPRGQAFAAKLEGHRELGLRVIGFLDSDPDIATSDRWPLLGSLDDIETILHSAVVDEVVICLPFSLWDRIDAIAGPVRGGGQDRPDPDGRDGPRDLGRPGRGARRHAGVLARLGTGPGPRPGHQARARSRSAP